MNGGIVLLDKPSGMTSFDCDKIVRRATGIKKVGHSGTLDPFATGLLPVFVGDALKFMRYTDDYDKTYQCRALFGKTSDTGDSDGVIECVKRPSSADFETIRSALAEVASRTEQVPPKYSAKKINGVKAYDLARKGVEFTLKPNKIKVYSLEVSDMSECGDGVAVDFTVHCSKGTYIRTICTDAGDLSGFGAYAMELRRIKAGPFCVEDAVRAEDIGTGSGLNSAPGGVLGSDRGRGPGSECGGVSESGPGGVQGRVSEIKFIDPVITLSAMPVVVLSDKHADDIRCGRRIAARALDGFSCGDGVLCKAVSSEGSLIAVIYSSDGVIRIDRGFCS